MKTLALALLVMLVAASLTLSCGNSEPQQKRLTLKDVEELSDDELRTMIEDAEGENQLNLVNINPAELEAITGELSFVRAIQSSSADREYVIAGVGQPQFARNQNILSNSQLYPFSQMALSAFCRGSGCGYTPFLPRWSLGSNYQQYLGQPMVFRGFPRIMPLSSGYGIPFMPMGFSLAPAGIEICQSQNLGLWVFDRCAPAAPVVVTRHWNSKSLDVMDSCPQGQVMVGIEMKHPMHHNLTYQESFRILCATIPIVAPRVRTQLVQKWDLTVNQVCQGFATGIRFTHPLHRNYTHQESVQLECSAAPLVAGGCYRTPWKSKHALHERFHCQAGYAVRGVSFHHPMHHNLTYQESVQLECCPAFAQGF